MAHPISPPDTGSLTSSPLQFKRTIPADPDFIELVKQLDAYLTDVDGDQHAFYDQFNKPQLLSHAVVAYLQEVPVGCGGLKLHDADTAEVKRMYVMPALRGQGIGRGILNALQAWARELGCSRSVLETGKRQQEAVALYASSGYSVIPNYGQYVGVENSVCFEKILAP